MKEFLKTKAKTKSSLFWIKYLFVQMVKSWFFMNLFPHGFVQR